MLPRPFPATYASPERTSGISADRATANGGPNALRTYSSGINASNGTPGSANSASRAARIRSQLTMTRRRGYRSAYAARNGPPTTLGSHADEYATAANNPDP